MDSALRRAEVIMVMPLHTFSAPGVALQERVVYAIREEAHDLSHRLERVTDGDAALELIHQLGDVVDSWRAERLKLIREYVSARVRPGRWKVAARRGQSPRELDVDTRLCVAHAWRWLRPDPIGPTPMPTQLNTSVIASTSLPSTAEM